MNSTYVILGSSEFQNFGKIPAQYTCEGEGVNPPLLFRAVPQDAKSLVLIVDDPDAPGGLFIHWVLWNIPPNIEEVLEDSVPSGAVEGENSAGEIGWTPPCPPSGVHHYRFELSALSHPLALDEGATREQVVTEMEQFVLSRAELVGEYQKKANA